MVKSICPSFGDVYQLSGLSTDEKPTDVGVNSLFLELDTKDVYYFTGLGWYKVGEGPQLQVSTGVVETPISY